MLVKALVWPRTKAEIRRVAKSPAVDGIQICDNDDQSAKRCSLSQCFAGGLGRPF